MPTCTWPELLTVGRSLKRPAEHWRVFVEQGPYARGGIRRPVIHIQTIRGRYYILESTPTSQCSTRSSENWLLEFAWQHVGSHNPRLGDEIFTHKVSRILVRLVRKTGALVVRKVDGGLQSQTFVHIIENCLQDTPAVVCILEHTLRTLKFEHPEITSAFLHQDNAGCYHNSVLMATCNIMKSKTSVRVRQLEFSNPQGREGACNKRSKWRTGCPSWCKHWRKVCSPSS